MKDLKGDHQSSIFPVKLLMAYVVSFSLLFTISVFAEDNQGREIEGWNAELEFSLVLCVPLLWLIYSALRHSRRMPVFAVIMALIALWHVIVTLIEYCQMGFDPRFDLDLALLNCLIAALVWGVPFVVIYLVWRFWPRKQAEGLPAP